MRVSVHEELWRAETERELGDARRCERHFPGWKRTEVTLTDAGKTGRERRNEAGEGRLAAARLAAERSVTVQALLRVFGGRIEEVEARTPTVDDNPEAVDEVNDE